MVLDIALGIILAILILNVIGFALAFLGGIISAIADWTPLPMSKEMREASSLDYVAAAKAAALASELRYPSKH